MEHIQSVFSIKDLENLSGIKAHTIRIWEKRYRLLEPDRTDTNIRFYSIKSLQKLLNVSLLNTHGFKISKIADLKNGSFEAALDSVINAIAKKDDFINKIKVSMLNYDAALFEQAYQKIAETHDFSTVFNEYFVPFLNEIGLLWQSGSINPTHEHFVSNLIKQKILVEIQKEQIKPVENDGKLFVLFLPDNEIHDIGLTYLQYEILKKGYKAIMLGASVPVYCLEPFSKLKQKVVYVSYFTVKPELDKVVDYLKEFSQSVLSHQDADFYVLGRQISVIEKDKLDIPNVHPCYSINEALLKI